MFYYPPTIIIRHKRENLKKCSLAGLEKRTDVLFFSYPLEKKIILSDYLLLSLEPNAPEITKVDKNRGILLLDATWRLALKMEKNIDALQGLEKRSLPSGFQTAYPRRQQDCPDPQKGLSSLEALAIAYHVLGRDTELLWENYYWKENFFTENLILWKNF